MQHAVAEYMKKHDYTKIHQILIVVDDFADSPNFTRQSKLLHQLYIRGRHVMISTVTATSVYCITPYYKKEHYGFIRL